MWRELEEAITSVVMHKPYAQEVSAPHRLWLGGFGRTIVVGGAALALIILAAGIVIRGATGELPSTGFDVLTFGMFLIAVLGFGYMLTRVISVALASR